MPSRPDLYSSLLDPASSPVPRAGSLAPAPGDQATGPARHPAVAAQLLLPGSGNMLHVPPVSPPALPLFPGTRGHIRAASGASRSGLLLLPAVPVEAGS